MENKPKNYSLDEALEMIEKFNKTWKYLSMYRIGFFIAMGLLLVYGLWAQHSKLI